MIFNLRFDNVIKCKILLEQNSRTRQRHLRTNLILLLISAPMSLAKHQSRNQSLEPKEAAMMKLPKRVCQTRKMLTFHPIGVRSKLLKNKEPLLLTFLLSQGNFWCLTQTVQPLKAQTIFLAHRNSQTQWKPLSGKLAKKYYNQKRLVVKVQRLPR